MTSTKLLFKFTIHFVVAVGLLGCPALAQQLDKGANANPSQFLKIYVLDGQGATNSIPQRKVTTPVVEVRDENDLPVEGAEVVFQLPEAGPGGTFPDGKHRRTVLTNLQGQANAPFFISTQEGKFEMTVSARKVSRVGTGKIEQVNSSRPIEDSVRIRRPWYKNWKYLALAGAAATAVTAAITLTGGSSKSASSAPTPTIVITPGSPTFGGPR